MSTRERFGDPAQEVLSREPGILENLSAGERAQFLSRCSEQEYRKGEYLCQQGSLHTENFVVRSGLVRTFYVAPSGREITLGYWSTGNLLGGPNFFAVCTHIWSAQAVRDSRSYVIKAADFRALTLEVPAIADCVMRALSFKMRWFSLLCQMLGTEPAHRRVARLLQILAPIYGEQQLHRTVLRVNFTQEEIGNMVGATRVWVSRAFGRLQRAGALHLDPAHRIVLDLDALETFLADGSRAPRAQGAGSRGSARQRLRDVAPLQPEEKEAGE